MLFGRVARLPAESPLRQSTFHSNGLELHIGRFVRRIGRPRQDWSSQVLKAASESLGWDELCGLLSDRSSGSSERWASRVKLAFQFLDHFSRLLSMHHPVLLTHCVALHGGVVGDSPL